MKAVALALLLVGCSQHGQPVEPKPAYRWSCAEYGAAYAARLDVAAEQAPEHYTAADPSEIAQTCEMADAVIWFHSWAGALAHDDTETTCESAWLGLPDPFAGEPLVFCYDNP